MTAHTINAVTSAGAASGLCLVANPEPVISLIGKAITLLTLALQVWNSRRLERLQKSKEGEKDNATVQK